MELTLEMLGNADFDIDGIVEDKKEDIEDISELFAEKEEPIDAESDKDKQEGVDREDLPDGKSDQEDKKSAENEDDGSSPDNLYTSIAMDLYSSGTLTLDESKIKEIKTPEDLHKAFEDQVQVLLDNNYKRINDALKNEIPVDNIREFEGVINFLNNVSEEVLKQENEQGEDIRKRLIYQDYINRGFSQERAEKEVKKSFDMKNDIEDALESLTSNKDFFNSEYDKAIEDAKKAKELKIKEENKQIEDLKKRIMDTEEPINGLKLSKQDRQKIQDLTFKIIDRGSDGKPLTAIQKYAKENPMDYQYNINLLFSITDGFKNISKVIDNKVKEGTKSKLSNLERVLKSSNQKFDSGLNFENSKDGESFSGINIVLD